MAGSFLESRYLDFRSSALSLLGAKSPQRELSLPWTFRSVEHSLLWNFRSSGVNVPRTFAPWNWNFRSSRKNRPIPRTFDPKVHKTDLTV